MSVGVLHPGELGAAVAGALRERGESVLWASAGRSAATAERADAAGLEDARDIAEACRRCEILLSISPPQWRLSIPELEENVADAERSAGGKGWRWIGEMEEIAHSMAAHDLPTGFHEAAAEVFHRAAEESS